MPFEADSTVLVVCADEAQAATLLDRLHADGVNAVGPVATAAMALGLAAQTAASGAILAGPTTGRRDVCQLAEELDRIWGIPCVVIPAESDGA